MNHMPECIDIWYGTFFKSIQMKSLGSCMTWPQGLKILHNEVIIHREILEKRYS